MKTGIFVISIDTELLWGRKDLDYSPFINSTKKEREIIKKLLDLFKKYSISTTWAIVGKLYEGNDSLWSGKDIINSIKSYKIHELASHSYSHEDISKINKEDAVKEFSKPKAKTFVFPRNHIAYLPELKKAGFLGYRGKDESEYELLLPRFPHTGKVKKVNNLVEIPSSLYFVSARGLRKYIPNGLRLFKSKLGINRAIKNKEIFHIWFHPVDFANNTTKLLNEFEEILKYADKKRREGLLEVKAMDQIVKEFNSVNID